jgi:hypothetical protein
MTVSTQVGGTTPAVRQKYRGGGCPGRGRTPTVWAMPVLGRLRGAVDGRPWVADAAVAAVAFGVTLLTTLGGLRPWREQLGLPEVLVAGITCGVLVLRRRRPFVVLAVGTAGALVYAPVSDPRGWVVAATQKAH